MTGEAEEALGGNEIKTIEDLINGVRTLYLIDDDIHELIFKMRRIIQGENETVVQYTNRLRKIVLKIKELKKREATPDVDLRKFDAEEAKKYKKGLKSEIKYELGTENTVEDISRAAIEIETDIRKRKEIS
ncbi:hypothetical protein TSAR_004311 [Trichomalopsis sarcophagae]|uniref:Retrotransposon gag domain-containing protein n=1 Tax=Trichomalopsis sarcophagae TaxID=543379 RepID=A0A232EGT9_9HYME|nr:hypothetical protein TSAR_004311 [Trichomalopsis sarcophagae]